MKVRIAVFLTLLSSLIQARPALAAWGSFVSMVRRGPVGQLWQALSRRRRVVRLTEMATYFARRVPQGAAWWPRCSTEQPGALKRR